MDILQSDERQAGSCHIVTTSIHGIILQHLLWKRYARHLAKCKPVRHDKEEFQSCPKVITDFHRGFDIEFSLAYYWVGLKPFGNLAVKFYDKGVGFS